jgi:hypothetical protein
MKVVGGLAYLAAGSSVRVLDLSRPTSPVELGASPVDALRVDVVRGLVHAVGGGGLHIVDFGPEYGPRFVSIDIKPRSQSNRLNPRSGGSIRLAVLGSETFDVAGIDVSTLGFGPAGAASIGRIVRKDVNRDGLEDLLARFRKRETGITLGDTEACLSGQLLNGARFEGCDAVRTPPRR